MCKQRPRKDPENGLKISVSETVCPYFCQYACSFPDPVILLDKTPVKSEEANFSGRFLIEHSYEGHYLKTSRQKTLDQDAFWPSTPMQVYAAAPTYCGNRSGNELTRNSSGNSRPQSSHLAEPLWTDPDLKIEISVGELIST